MNLARVVMPLLCLAFAGAAHAGDSGAGPAGSAGPGVGSIVTPGSHSILDTPWRDDKRKRILPGNGGAVRVAADQVAHAADVLRGFDGASVTSDVVRAPTVLADGTPAVIALDTKTGQLTVTRQEN